MSEAECGAEQPGLVNPGLRFAPSGLRLLCAAPRPGHERLCRGDVAFVARMERSAIRGILTAIDSEKSCLEMRKIVDSNFLQTENLRRYLAASNKNYAVLTDYAAMEAYKGNTLSSIHKSMNILAQYPKQVIVLKGTQTICGLRGRRAGLQRRMIDNEQTRDFEEYCQRLTAAKMGDKNFERQLLKLGGEATAHLNRMRADAERMPEHFEAIASTLTHEEIRAIRAGRQPIEAMGIDKLVKNIMLVAGFLFRDHPRVTRFPIWREAPYTYIFRASISTYLWVLRWISFGGAKGAKPEIIRNDLVDISFSAYATFFDGLLTSDQKLTKLHSESVQVLREVVDSIEGRARPVREP